MRMQLIAHILFLKKKEINCNTHIFYVHPYQIIVSLHTFLNVRLNSNSGKTGQFLDKQRLSAYKLHQMT